VNSVYYKILICFSLLILFSGQKSYANGCTGSWFNIEYSPWCDCYQVCGNYISDCDQLVSLTWNFGDGTTYSGGFPCHRYSQPGTYTVTMTVKAYCHNSFFNLFTSTCHITKQINVPTTHSMLDANFTTDTVCLGGSMQFTNTSVAPSGNNNYTWIFGDGTTSSAQNPVHVFDSCGVYDVKLIVKNNTPCCSIPGYDTIVKRVYVNCPPNSNSNQLGDTDPYIEESTIDVITSSGTCLGDVTQFGLNMTGPITSWVFHFPDSSTSTSATPTYTYSACPPAIPFTYVNATTNRGCVGLIDSVTGIFCPSNITFSSTTTVCSGQCSGTATVNISGGTPPYTIIWNDSAAQTTRTAVNLCPGPYNVTITDGNGCNAVPANPVNVLDFPNPFTGTVTIQGQVRCFGTNGGSAVLNLTGGTPPYKYFWANGITTSDVIDLPGGNSNVTATDANGCIFVTTVNIPQPPPITATFTTVNASCGSCNGSATVNASGGSVNVYKYTWLTTPVRTTQTVTGLCAGVYFVVVEGNDTFSVAINENGAQPITVTSTDARCFNICDGTATVNLTGGCQNPPCSYAWLDSAANPIGQTTATASNLCAGRYTIRVTNGLGCRSFENVTVNIPNPIVPSANATPNTCGGNCSGTITASATGGATPFTYQWLDNLGNIIPGATNATITGRCAGNYSVRITDQQGCIVSANAIVFDNPMTATANFADVLCNNDCSGKVTIAAIGGVMPYTFILQDGNGATVYSGNSFIIANLCAGNYNAIARDANNCSISMPVTINEPAPLNPVPSTILPLCYGNCNGSVSVNVNGGTSPFSYEWINSNGGALPGGTSATVNNLCAGTYQVKITDANGCVTPFTQVPLLQPARLTDSLHVIDAYCTNGQGSIDLTVIGGTAPFSYSWNNGAYNTEDISGLSNGTYTVVITDANGCTATDNATFAQLPLLNITIDATLYNGYHFKCAGGTDGEIDVDVTGGLPPYSYLWNDSAASTTDSIYGLSSGTYTVTVTDANGCVRIDSIDLNLVPPPFSLSHNSTDATCFGSNDGTASVIPSGGVTPYVYFWDHDTTLIDIPLTGASPGEYYVLVFDGNFCLKIDTITISEPPPLTIAFAVSDVSCNSGNDGSIDLTINGGIVPYNYSWNNGTYNTEDINALTAGLYVVEVMDSNNCLISDSALIIEPPAIQTIISTTNVSCYGGNNGTINLSVTGGTSPFSFNWNNGTYSTEDLSNISSGNYFIVVTDTNNCTATDSAIITEPNIITGSRSIKVCVGDSFLVGGNYQTSDGIYIDTIFALNGCDSVLSTNLTFVNQFTTDIQDTICFGSQLFFGGIYRTAEGIYVDSLLTSKGCDSIITLTLDVLPDIGLNASPESATLIYDDSISISIFSNADAGVLTYTWTPSGGINCNDCNTTILHATEDITYSVVAVDANGCRDTVLIPVIVKGGVIYVPNAFTPDGDGVNDIFKIYGRGFKTFRLIIFDRWGEKIFETIDPNSGWDGTYKGKELTPGVYVYYVDIEFFSGKAPEEYYHYKKGSVTLIK
jgi:gliding motility-associated-like protein